MVMFMLIVNNDNNVGEVVLATLKVAPPLTVTGMIFYGYTVQDWACILTIIWVIVQIYIEIHNHVISCKKICPICHKKHK